MHSSRRHVRCGGNATLKWLEGSWRFVVATAAMALLHGIGSVCAQTTPVIGLVTKTETNPFFVKMREGAQAAASSRGARLLTGREKPTATTPAR